jgi:2-oxoglutarate dehydrogenase E2 component (dihydrolipoamide succinyltransferase)
MALVDIILSADQTEGTKAVVSHWLYSEGDFVEKDQPIIELETDKVMMEVVAPESGVLSVKLLDTGDEVTDSIALGQIDNSAKASVKLVTIAANEKVVERREPPVLTTTSKAHKSSHTNSQLISPSVRRLLNQHQLNLNNIIGTGKSNRITSRDVQLHLKSNKNSISSEHRPLDNMRKSIAAHMVDSLLHTAPHVTSVFNLDLSTIIAHRKNHKQNMQDQGVNLTFTAYFIAASVAAIKQVPLINSQLHKDSIEVFNNINIGVGTALGDKGLIVPVLKNCENKNLFATAQTLSELTDKARNNKLKPSDVQGGTFTISNHGVSGSLIATPIIINQPQSAILGIGKMEKRVVVKEVGGEDMMVIKPMCYVTLTIDHRVLDAHQCNQFLSAFVDTLENWQ